MKKLTTEKEIKKYVVSTIKHGSAKEISRVMMRYYNWLEEQEKKKDKEFMGVAKKIFGVD